MNIINKIENKFNDLNYWFQENWVDFLLTGLLILFSPLIVSIAIVLFMFEYPYSCIKERRIIPSYEWYHYKWNQLALVRMYGSRIV